MVGLFVLGWLVCCRLHPQKYAESENGTIGVYIYTYIYIFTVTYLHIYIYIHFSGIPYLFIYSVCLIAVVNIPQTWSLDESL